MWKATLAGYKLKTRDAQEAGDQEVVASTCRTVAYNSAGSPRLRSVDHSRFAGDTYIRGRKAKPR